MWRKHQHAYRMLLFAIGLLVDRSRSDADPFPSQFIREPAEPANGAESPFASPEESPTPLLDSFSRQSVGQSENCSESSRPEFADPNSGWLQNLTLFGGIDGSKQPQDFGVNANLGVQGNLNTAFSLREDSGLGLQVGTGIVASQNAVQVYELLGEATSRTQSYTTIGLFQKSDSGFLWAVAHDFLVEDSYDTFLLSQWRGRMGLDVSPSDQIGVTVQIRGLDDAGRFNGGPVSLRTINQGSLYWRHIWESRTQTTLWLGLADGHGENNAAFGPAPALDTVPLLGADFLAPLNSHLALYGETNLIMPADTGTVDAFLGIQWFPGGGAFEARQSRTAPVFSVASPTTMSVDLR